MNRKYKLKFNRRTMSLDAVTELATQATAGKSSDPTVKAPRLSLTLSTLAALVCTGASLAYAAAEPRTGMSVVHGQVQTQIDQAVTTYTTSDNTIINWEKFNINSNELVKFVQANANSAVLNRVLGGSVSQILGTLQSNGKVFIVNPAGIVFGKEAQVDVASLVASTLDISNDDFIQGNYVFNQEKDQALASVLNQGVIKVNADGTIALVGGQVTNTGVLEAKNGTVYLLAGQSITIQDLDNPLISYKVSADNHAVNLGAIFSKNVALVANKVAHGGQFADLVNGETPATQARIEANGEVLLYAGAVAPNLQTTADAHTTPPSTQGGLVVQAGTISQANKVAVLGDTVVVQSQSSTQGREVLLGGDLQGQGQVKLASRTYVQAGAQVDASASSGDAGRIIVWGDKAYIDGTFTAQASQGQGGFIETSAKHLQLGKNFSVDTQGATGKGQWLIDPENLNVVNSTTYAEKTANEKVELTEFTQPEVSYQTAASDAGQTDSYLLDSQLGEALKNTNVSLTATNNLSFISAEVSTDTTYDDIATYYGVDGANGTLTLTADNISLTNTNLKTRAVNFTANNLTITSSKIEVANNLTTNTQVDIKVTGEENSFKAYTVVLLSQGNTSLENLNIRAGQHQPAGITNVTSFNINSKGNVSLTNVDASVNFGQVRLTGTGHTYTVKNSKFVNNWQEVLMHGIRSMEIPAKDTPSQQVEYTALEIDGTTVEALANYYVKAGSIDIRNTSFRNQREDVNHANASTIYALSDTPSIMVNLTLNTTNVLQLQSAKNNKFIFIDSCITANGIETNTGDALKALEAVNTSITAVSSLKLNVQEDLTLRGSEVTAGSMLTLGSTAGNLALLEEGTKATKVTNSNGKITSISAGQDLLLGNAKVEAGASATSLLLTGNNIKSVAQNNGNFVLDSDGTGTSLISKNEINLQDAQLTTERGLSITSKNAITVVGSTVKSDSLEVRSQENGKLIFANNKLEGQTQVTLSSTDYEYYDNTGSGATVVKANSQDPVEQKEESKSAVPTVATAPKEDAKVSEEKAKVASEGSSTTPTSETEQKESSSTEQSSTSASQDGQVSEQTDPQAKGDENSVSDEAAENKETTVNEDSENNGTSVSDDPTSQETSTPSEKEEEKVVVPVESSDDNVEAKGDEEGGAEEPVQGEAPDQGETTTTGNEQKTDSPVAEEPKADDSQASSGEESQEQASKQEQSSTPDQQTDEGDDAKGEEAVIAPKDEEDATPSKDEETVTPPVAENETAKEGEEGSKTSESQTQDPVTDTSAPVVDKEEQASPDPKQSEEQTDDQLGKTDEQTVTSEEQSDTSEEQKETQPSAEEPVVDANKDDTAESGTEVNDQGTGDNEVTEEPSKPADEEGKQGEANQTSEDEAGQTSESEVGQASGEDGKLPTEEETKQPVEENNQSSDSNNQASGSESEEGKGSEEQESPAEPAPDVTVPSDDQKQTAPTDEEKQSSGVSDNQAGNETGVTEDPAENTPSEDKKDSTVEENKDSTVEENKDSATDAGKEASSEQSEPEPEVKVPTEGETEGKAPVDDQTVVTPGEGEKEVSDEEGKESSEVPQDPATDTKDPDAEDKDPVEVVPGDSDSQENAGDQTGTGEEPVTSGEDHVEQPKESDTEVKKPTDEQEQVTPVDQGNETSETSGEEASPSKDTEVKAPVDDQAEVTPGEEGKDVSEDQAKETPVVDPTEEQPQDPQESAPEVKEPAQEQGKETSNEQTGTTVEPVVPSEEPKAPVEDPVVPSEEPTEPAVEPKAPETEVKEPSEAPVEQGKETSGDQTGTTEDPVTPTEEPKAPAQEQTVVTPVEQPQVPSVAPQLPPAEESQEENPIFRPEFIFQVTQGVSSEEERRQNDWLLVQPRGQENIPVLAQDHQPLVIRGDVPAPQNFLTCKVNSSAGRAALTNLGVNASDLDLSLGEISAKYNLSANDVAALEVECQ
ncbi:hypothetical protein CJP74_05540 [Psittacicella melopsittaci]|uniref:Filamentous haemagglutinin FhaB/tRNA nuclease CdiA-like TPS domain-containing protein n=1 Tax=Psittacicella melopsittaci TaxID=2028576 RepID=A0A3A1Y477_9GAMM|nr:filamentous hemagglutinin N-terminal domain-containing protein [Psittacicella melopsittaci]RIY32109.1 hypothetical protein CJP74_05540 [Psittacicella melopsittaci]